MRRGRIAVSDNPIRKESLLFSGARPPYPRRPWLLRSLRSLPAPRRGAFCACAVRLRRATRVRSLRSPLRALAPGFASGSTRSPPPALALGGGVSGLSLLPCGPLPAGLPPLLAAVGWWLPLVAVGFCGGCVVASFSLVGSRSLVLSRGALVAPLSAPWWRRLVGSALAAGARRWRVRRSARSFSGAVVVVGFGSAASASAFASAWSGWVGFPLAVRRFAGGVFGVSVPVAVPPSLRLAAPAALPAPVAWVGA